MSFPKSLWRLPAGRPAMPFDVELDPIRMNLMTPLGFSNALFYACSLVPGSGHMTAPVCSSWVFLTFTRNYWYLFVWGLQDVCIWFLNLTTKLALVPVLENLGGIQNPKHGSFFMIGTPCLGIEFHHRNSLTFSPGEFWRNSQPKKWFLSCLGIEFHHHNSYSFIS